MFLSFQEKGAELIVNLRIEQRRARGVEFLPVWDEVNDKHYLKKPPGPAQDIDRQGLGGQDANQLGSGRSEVGGPGHRVRWLRTGPAEIVQASSKVKRHGQSPPPG